MKTIQKQTLLNILVLGLLAGSLAAGTLYAQLASPAATGEFTLPFETHWGKAVLPPGDYSFSVRQVSDNTALVTIRSRKTSAAVMTSAINSCENCGTSALLVLRQGDQRTVQALRLAGLGLTLYYGPHREVEELLAQKPGSVERVPVLAAKK